MKRFFVGFFIFLLFFVFYVGVFILFFWFKNGMYVMYVVLLGEGRYKDYFNFVLFIFLELFMENRKFFEFFFENGKREC